MQVLPFISEDIIARLKKGDETAFRIIFDTYSSRLFSFAYRFLKEKEQSEEIVQETFLALWINRANIDPKYPVGAYLFTIARRSTLNKLRHTATSRAYREKLWQTTQEAHNETEETVLLGDLKRITEEGLVKLSDRQQQIFRLSRYEGLNHEEIADRLNISTNTVKNHMVEALKYLRIHIKQSGAVFLCCIYLI